MKITVVNKEGITKRRSVKIGSLFPDTIYQRASYDKVHWFNVYVNGKSIPNETHSPAFIESWMDIIIIHEDADKG